MTVSVALAAYNGEKFIKEQIDSILASLPPQSEVVVSLDPSRDGTEEIINAISARDGRVRLIYGPGKGLIANFENAVRACTGEIIFLSDQDDVWFADKADKVLAAFASPDVLAVMHDASVTDGALTVTEQSFFAAHGRRSGTFQNWLRNSYIGCCMAFRRELRDVILPFPATLPMHDQWIGILAGQAGRVAIVDEPLIYWRRHGDNSSSTTHAPIGKMLRWRVFLARDLLARRGAVRALRAKLKAREKA